ncbi:MAG: GNAT family N-acetyltransferase [Micropruina sp.]|uniref:GNAT family N-acetyltransferase n=1 Tax=Micropruina sp. TaxID=2737536 RepID=UPI0039E26FDB
MESAQPPPVRVEELTRHPDRLAAAALLAGIWGVPPAESPVPADLMTALSHAGGCVLGAWTPDGALVGVTIGFAGAPGSDRIYSYIAGVAASFAGRGLGRRLKLAQRDWALARGAATLTWTYDPLIRRNGHFNLNRLGGRVTDFVRDYYPPMLDAVNAGDLPDRFVVEWTLADEPDGHPLPDGSPESPVVLSVVADAPEVRHAELAEAVRGSGGAGIVRAWVPSDIEGLRGGDPALGRRWRLAAREVFGTLFAGGLRPVGIDPDGHYVFVKGA